MTRHYLDAASSAPLRPIARAAMHQALDLPSADPGRIHEEGMTVRHQLELARSAVAGLVGGRASEVIFTSSASEGIAMVIRGCREREPGGTIIATAVEHSAVRLGAGDSLHTVGVSRSGRVDPADVASSIDTVRAGGGTVALVACQLGNHEIGTLQPAASVAAVCRDRDVPLLVDAAQAVGQVGIDFAALGATYLAISGPKFGGPPGSGAVLVRRGTRVPPLIVGGDQERGRRAGLENTPAMVGLGAACAELADTRESENRSARRHTDRLRQALAAVDGLAILGPERETERLPHIVNMTIEGIEPQAVLLALDRAGIAAHSGSACASESLEPSPILEAIGVDAHHSLRLSVSWATADHDIDATTAALPPILDRLRALRN